MEPLVLRTTLDAVVSVIAPFEAKGFELIGVKTAGGGAIIAFRASSAACAAGRGMVDVVRGRLGPGTILVASATVSEALDWMYGVFGPRDISQWQPDDGDACARPDAERELQGTHNGNVECFRLAELVQASSVGSEAGTRFCDQLRRDSYVPILLPASERRRFAEVEDGAAEWFALDEDAKTEEAGAYGHIDRKFTGYRNGKFREQLEVRQRLDANGGVLPSGIHPQPRTPASFGLALGRLVNDLDGIARALLRHVARDVGADDGFFDGLLDPLAQPAAHKGRRSASSGGADEAEPPLSLGHSLIRLCKYDAEDEGVYGSNVLCEAHNDVGFLTLDVCASVSAC